MRGQYVGKHLLDDTSGLLFKSQLQKCNDGNIILIRNLTIPHDYLLIGIFMMNCETPILDQ